MTKVHPDADAVETEKIFEEIFNLVHIHSESDEKWFSVENSISSLKNHKLDDNSLELSGSAAALVSYVNTENRPKALNLAKSLLGDG